MNLERDLGTIFTKLENIEDLLLTQNGRVSRLEDKVDNLRLWRASLIGIGGFVGAGITFLLGLFR